MKISKIIGLIAMTVMFCTPSFGQSALKGYELTSDWKLITQKDGVQFYVKKQECTVQGAELPYVYTLLKMVNSNATAKTVSYNYAHHFEDGCDGCDEDSERAFKIEIPANTTLQEDCSFKLEGFSGFVSNPNHKDGSKFQAVDIKFLQVN